jgi:hypothetical protein
MAKKTTRKTTGKTTEKKARGAKIAKKPRKPPIGAAFSSEGCDKQHRPPKHRKYPKQKR